MRATRVSIGNGGWVRYQASDLPQTIYLRFVEAGDGRLELVDAFLPFEAPPRATDLRGVAEHILDAEAAVNAPDVREQVVDSLGLPGPDLRTAAAFYGTTFGEPDQHWVSRMFDAQKRGSGEPKPRAPKPPAPPELRETFDENAWRINVPESRPYPDGFYEVVAAIYAELAQWSKRPAAELAEANDVPVKTVHRWVAEARKRGHLAPGRQGRAG